MIFYPQKQHDTYKTKLSDATKDNQYRYERYGFNYSVAIFYSPTAIDMSDIFLHARSSDTSICLDDFTNAIVLDGANDEKGMKAVENIQECFEEEHFGEILYLGVVTASNYDSHSRMIEELFDIINYAISNKRENMIVDFVQLH